MDWVIPEEVATSTKVNSNEKLLYGYLKTLIKDKDKDYIALTNKELSDYFTLKPRTISQSVSALDRNEFIRREVIRDDKNQVLERRIYILI